MKKQIKKNPKIILFFSLGAVILIITTFLIYTIDYHSQDYKNKNLIANGSFEKGIDHWQIETKEFIEPIMHRDIKLNLDLEYLEKPISFEYLPEIVEGELVKSLIFFEFYAQEKKVISRLTYVVSGTSDHWFHQDIIIGDINYLTKILPAKVGEWNNIQIENLLADHNLKAQDINAPTLKTENITKVTCSLSVWAIQGANIKAQYRNLPQYFQRTEYDNEVVDFAEYQKEEPSFIKAFLYLPSNGEKFARVLGRKNDYISQRIERLDTSKEYLLLFDAKNEFGLMEPMVRILDEEENTIASKIVTMHMTQLGWTRTAILFTPKTSAAIIKLGNGDLPGYYYANNYDNLKLYEIPKDRKKKFLEHIQKQYDVSIAEDGNILEKEVDYTNLLSPDFKKSLDLEYDNLGIPVYDLFFDEYAFWHEDTMPENFRYWAYRIKGGYKNMFPAKLVMDDKEYNARIKPRGVMTYHHSSRIKSFRINTSKNERFDLVRPATRDFLAEYFSYYLASRLNLISLRNDFVFLRINHKPIGVYWKFIRDEKDLELNQRPEGYLIGPGGGPYLFDRADDSWEQYAKPSNKNYIKRYPYGQLINFFISLLENNDIENAARLVDIDKLLTWNVHSILMGSAHQVHEHNNFIYWNTALGKFEWIPWDVRWGYDIDVNPESLKNKKSLLFTHYNPFVEEFLEEFPYYNQRNRLLWNYVKDQNNLEQDISFFDKTYERTRQAFAKTVDYEAPHVATKTMDFLPFSQINEILLSIKKLYPLKFSNLKKYFEPSNQINISLKKLKNKLKYNDHHYNILEIGIAPSLNNAISSTLIDKIEVKKANPEDKIYLLDSLSNKMIAASYDHDQASLRVNKYIPSDLFLEYKIEFFWRDHFDGILKKLETDPSKLNFFKNNYNLSSQVRYEIKPESAQNPKIVKEIISILEEIEEIKEKRNLSFYLLYQETELDPKTDISFLIKNGVTEEKIIPQIIQGQDIYESVLGQKATEPKKEITLDPDFDYNSLLRHFTDISMSVSLFTEKNPMFQRAEGEGNAVVLKQGTYEISEDIIIPERVKLTIQPGATLKFAENTSLISYGRIIAQGTREKPIIFTAQDEKKPWGVVGLLRQNAQGEFENCLFERGGDAYINGVYFSGMLSGYYTNIHVKSCQFQYASQKSGDDALNFKNSLASVEDSYFYKNQFDAIDFDFMKEDSKIVGNYFLENGNDGLDISASKILVSGNKIEQSGDKGISLGEETEVFVSNNIIQNSRFGVAVKDLSRAKIVNNNISQNKIGVAAYNKKRIFGGADVFVYNTLFENNGLDFGIEKIDEKDDRTKEEKYQSNCFVTNSKFKTTQRITKEIIQEPAKNPKTKKAFLKAYLNDSLTDYDYQFTILIDKPDLVKLKNNPYQDSPIGILSEFSAATTDYFD